MNQSLPKIEKGDRVRHNYDDGHGDGTVLESRNQHKDDRLNILVQWDSGKGPFRYTYTNEIQEIIKI